MSCVSKGLIFDSEVLLSTCTIKDICYKIFIECMSKIYVPCLAFLSEIQGIVCCLECHMLIGRCTAICKMW